jgi:hypothetical protein
MGLYNTLRGVDVTSSGVMAGLVSIVKKDVDARDKPTGVRFDFYGQGA